VKEDQISKGTASTPRQTPSATYNITAARESNISHVSSTYVTQILTRFI